MSLAPSSDRFSLFRSGNGCWSVLDVLKDFVIASYASPACQPRLVRGRDFFIFLNFYHFLDDVQWKSANGSHARQSTFYEKVLVNIYKNIVHKSAV